MDQEGEKLSPDLATDDTIRARKSANAGDTGSQVMHSRAERPWSFDVADFSLPNGREEEWRFTPIKKIARLFEDAASEEVDGAPAAKVSFDGPESWLAGKLAQGESPRDTVLRPSDRAAVVGSANAPEALHVRVPDNEERREPVTVRIVGQSASARSNNHLVVEAGANSHSTVVIEHTGSAVHNGNVEVIVGQGATLTVISLQRWNNDTLHVGQHDAEVGKDAHYKHINVTLGGDVVRLNSNVRFADEGANAQLFGLYFADSGQHLEHRSFVDHNAPRNTSNVLYKGALQGEKAHTVWVGDVLIQKAAEGTDSYEKNQNLVLTDGARADSVPNLEIETGIIEGAGHASTTGQLDDEHLWYLMARGIPEKQARRLVVRGFLYEIIQQIRVSELEDSLMDALEDELAISNN
ncbi:MULTISPECIES: Fe-S cluster assembly protein SufD [Micrococcaceae]|uniref:Fe-S cluster assembly protein SufD n=1 Tax=unclassified Kocuria TaxID=2649579 RepID=UPI0010112253